MNLKEETIEAINGRTIAFAKIYDSYNIRQIFLSRKHTKKDMDYFFEQLDFEYNNGFLISGYIAFTDGTWITRSSYNGKNWWRNYKYNP